MKGPPTIGLPMKKWHTLLILVLISLSHKHLLAQPTKERISQDFSLTLMTDQRLFPQSGILPAQKKYYPSLAMKPEFSLEWKDGAQLLQFTGFARWEAHETRRTHWDIREFYWQMIQEDWELSIGVKKIFWGVTESIHLVDIVNQTDFVESFDGEEKLGQPMAHYSLITKAGTLDFFAMPYFRKRQFPGLDGRFQTPFPLEKDQLDFEVSGEEWRPSFAARWSHALGQVDIGLSHFYGVGREPIFQVPPGGDGFTALYPLIHQSGLDLQLITGAALWKFETIRRRNDIQNMWALAGGVEYTFSNTFKSGLDIGVLAEYLYDSRDELALSGMDNDLFLGTRLALNDVQSTQFLAGVVFDLSRSTRLFSIESSRRIGNSWKVELEARFLTQVSESEFLHFFRNDDFLQFRLVKYF